MTLLCILIADWWSTLKASTPNHQKFVVKVPNLTCSASGCKRHWSVFQHLSRILPIWFSCILKHLLYFHLSIFFFPTSYKEEKSIGSKSVKWFGIYNNRALRHQFIKNDSMDLILLEDIDESNEWLLGSMEDDNSGDEVEYVFGDDDLT